MGLLLVVAALSAAPSLADRGIEASAAAVLMVARNTGEAIPHRARLIRDLRLDLIPPPGLEPPGPLRLATASGGGGGILDPRGSRGVDAGIACVAGAIVPGLGHAVLGEYLPRGLAFTSAFAATLIGGIAALAHAQDSPRLRGQLLFAGFALVLSANVLYLWSVVDALMLSSRPRPSTEGPEHLLGRD